MNEAKEQQWYVVLFSRKRTYSTHHFCMKTVTSQLSFPKLLVPVSATRARIDLEVLYLTFTLTLKVNICWLAHGFKDKSLIADRQIKLHKARLNHQILMLLGHNVLIYCS